MTEWNGKASYSARRQALSYWPTLNRCDVITHVSDANVAQFLLDQAIADGAPKQPLEIED